ncbi:MAG TPA: [protein-PII] uridylyltransferase [Candidatus Saccharimonadales bacterium]|nr:[protein-PII] uridylyltransferase [Candidatus Saccharimonadales bacterium]
MEESVTPLSVLGPQCDAQRERIRKLFDNGASAQETLRQLCELADGTIRKVFGELQQVQGGAKPGLCLLALGGYGREVLFPYSDLDLLFLFASEKIEEESRPLIAEFSRMLWDLGFRVSSAGRTIDECKRIEQDNAEFHLAMLDRRFLDGDKALFEKLDSKVLSVAEKQARPFLLVELQRLTRDRLSRYGNTIFHLEPNVKDAPGGLRDFHSMLWMRQLAGDRRDPRFNPVNEDELTRNAVEFLSAIRCFLHYSNGRNDNTLTYELQAQAAERSLGIDDNLRRNAAEWMRLYFRHARTLNRQLLRYTEQRTQVTLSLRQRLLAATLGTKSEATDGSRPYAVRDGLLEITNEQTYADRNVTYALLTEAAQTGVPLSRDAERSIAYIMAHPELPQRNSRVAWPILSEILNADYPGAALRPMHRLGLLAEALPEFRSIDSLVVRDFYHRYTVDEHSLRTIEHLQDLGDSSESLGKHFSPIWKTADRRDLLILSLLLHDVGKGMPVENHVTGSLQALEIASDRLKLSPDEKAEVHFLIEHHLDMSATVQRRDIFDPATVSSFAAAVSTHERLQRLCLMTYADIHAVNPEALTPWKAEMLWQLFVATSNYFSRTADRDRLHASDERGLLEQVQQRAGGANKVDVERFLDGFPRRYLAANSAADIASHFALYEKLGTEPVQTEVKKTHHVFTLTLLSADRPALFATIAGALAAWGMNIVKADAFGNATGVVLDTFHFVDMHKTLELNPGEISRFQQSISDVVNGKQTLEPMLKGRLAASMARPPKVAVTTSINFDDDSSDHSTLVEVVTQDRPGLLYGIGSALARLGCNIDVALIDTEGQKAIDVFYLTSQGKKLAAQKQELLKEVLHGTLN